MLVLAGGGLGVGYLLDGSSAAVAGSTQATSQEALPSAPTFGNSGLDRGPGQSPRPTGVDSTPTPPPGRAARS